MSNVSVAPSNVVSADEHRSPYPHDPNLTSAEQRIEKLLQWHRDNCQTPGALLATPIGPHAVSEVHEDIEVGQKAAGDAVKSASMYP